MRGSHYYRDEFVPGEKRQLRKETRQIEKRALARDIEDELDQDDYEGGLWDLEPGMLTEWPEYYNGFPRPFKEIYPDDVISGYPDHYIINGDTSSCPCEEHSNNDEATA